MGAPPLSLSFDDVLLLPGKSSVLPAEVSLNARLTPLLGLNIPVLSSAMDTVTESNLAIALAREGGMGVIHRACPIDYQVEQVARVKRSENTMILDPLTVHPETSLREVTLLMRERGVSGRVKVALREAAMALGDVHLAGLRGPQATEAYLLAEALDMPIIPTEVRVSKTGAYPERITQQIEQAHFEDALMELDRWRDELPSDQVRGTPVFLRGKTAYRRGAYADAAHLLQLAVHLGEGAEFEAEARWWLAQAYKAAGDEKAYRANLQALIASGLAGPWRDKALEASKNAN